MVLKKIYLATTKDIKNNKLVEYSMTQDITVYRHDQENDIIGRLNQIIKLSSADALLKINGDCPLIDYRLLNNGVKIFKEKHNLDLLTNKLSNTFPLGYTFELVNSKVIQWCNVNLKSNEDRELVMLWIMKNKKVSLNNIQFLIISIKGIII